MSRVKNIQAESDPPSHRTHKYVVQNEENGHKDTNNSRNHHDEIAL